MRTLALGLALACLPSATARAQGGPRPGTATLDAVVAEIRLLRQAIERQSAASARAQLLLGRLTLQDQRTARARQAVERLENDLAAAEREAGQLRTAMRELTRSLEESTDPERRPQVEAELRIVRTRIAESQAQASSSQARLAQAREALDAETARYEELERWLGDVDRQLHDGQ